MNYRVIEKLEKEYPFFNLTIELPKDFYLSKDIKGYSELIETTKDSYFINGRAGTGRKILRCQQMEL